MKTLVFYTGFILFIFFIVLLTMLATSIDAILIAKRNKKKLENSERFREQLNKEETNNMNYAENVV